MEGIKNIHWLATSGNKKPLMRIVPGKLHCAYAARKYNSSLRISRMPMRIICASA